MLNKKVSCCDANKPQFVVECFFLESSVLIPHARLATPFLWSVLFEKMKKANFAIKRLL